MVPRDIPTHATNAYTIPSRLHLIYTAIDFDLSLPLFTRDRVILETKPISRNAVSYSFKLSRSLYYVYIQSCFDNIVHACTWVRYNIQNLCYFMARKRTQTLSGNRTHSIATMRESLGTVLGLAIPGTLDVCLAISDNSF